ncbi:MAG TPA: hypothetical protein VJ761_15350 [Ktedonobacteraceae bacterium]|nr:hypothetical protein [Ktedonobacteraceae bacterium]
MATDPRSLYDEVATELVATAPVKSGKMFGMPCLKQNESGKAFAGFYQGAMVFKLTGPQHGEALQLSGAHLFDPMGGRPMKEWVEVPAEHASRWVELAREALRYADEAQKRK